MLIHTLTRCKWQLCAIFALACTILFSLTSTSRAFTGVSLLQLSTDPYMNSSSQHQTEVEPHVFSYGSTLVSAFEVGRFAGPGPAGGSDNIGWATSTDGGNNWTYGFLRGITVYAGGSFARVTAPSVSYDARHNVWLIASQPFYSSSSGGGSAQVVSRSTDGGLTWSKPFTVTDLGPKVLLDKAWITCDNTATSPFYGHCYDEFDSHRQGNLILMNASIDGGKTWQGAKTTADNATGLGGQPVVQPDGTVVVPITTLFSPLTEESEPAVPINNAIRTEVLVFTSTDGGGSWSQTSVIQHIVSHKEAGGLRSNPLISAAIDEAGKIYLVWPDCRFETGCPANDIVMSTSTDGLTWSAVQRIPIDAVGSGVDHFIPGLGIDKSTSGNTGHIGLVYYYYPVSNCSLSTCELDVGFVSSTDDGTTFSNTLQLAGPMQLSWLPQSELGLMVGDYIATAFSVGEAHPVFAVASTPDGGVACSSPGAVCHEAIFTVSLKPGHVL